MRVLTSTMIGLELGITTLPNRRNPLVFHR